MSFLCFGQQAISPTMDDDNEEDAYTTPDEYFTSSDDDDDEGEQEEEKEAAEADSKPKKSFSSTKSSSYAVDATKHQQLLRVPRLTEPLKLDRKSSAGGKHQDAAAAAAKPKAAKTGGNGSLVASVVEVFKGFRPGSDLTKFQVPPQFNLPKSQLQVYGEAVYCCSQDLLGSCADGATAIDRFLAVVRWHLSTTRPAPFAKAPYNPILGETHHVSAGHLNVLCEQVIKNLTPTPSAVLFYVCYCLPDLSPNQDICGRSALWHHIMLACGVVFFGLSCVLPIVPGLIFVIQIFVQGMCSLGSCFMKVLGKFPYECTFLRAFSYR
jgi:hypothetical protein